MKKSLAGIASVFLPLWLLSRQPIAAQGFIDLETGLASTRYNDVRVPNQGGTLFSLTDDLSIDPSAFIRLRLGYRLGKRHNLSLLIAPLTLKAKGQVDKDLNFIDETFPAATPLEGKYTFNSYRLTFRLDLKRSPQWIIGIGMMRCETVA